MCFACQDLMEKQFKICLKQKRRVCLTEYKNENLLETESEMKLDNFEWKSNKLAGQMRIQILREIENLIGLF